MHCQVVQTVPKKCGRYIIITSIYQALLNFLVCVEEYWNAWVQLRLIASHLYEARRTALECFLNLQQSMELYYIT